MAYRSDPVAKHGDVKWRCFQVKQMEELRGAIPHEHASIYVCKNSLLKIAADQVDGWSSLRPVAKVSNQDEMHDRPPRSSDVLCDRKQMPLSLWMKMASQRSSRRG